MVAAGVEAAAQVAQLAVAAEVVVAQVATAATSAPDQYCSAVDHSAHADQVKLRSSLALLSSSQLAEAERAALCAFPPTPALAPAA